MIVIACGALLGAAFITLLRAARGERLWPRALPPLRVAAITAETPAPAPSVGAGAGTTEGDL